MSERTSIVEVLRSQNVTDEDKNALLKSFVERIVYTKKSSSHELGDIGIYLR